MSGMNLSHRFPTLFAAVAATTLLAACGSSNKNDAASGQAADDAKQHAFATCMRKAGLDVKEGTGGGGGSALAIGIPKGIPPQRLQKIQGDCARKTGGGPHPPSKAEQARFLDAALKFARCMRAHGVNLPDPKASGGGIMVQKGSSSSSSRSTGPDPSNPAFQSAQKQCESLLPGGKGKGPMLATRGAGPGGPPKGKGDTGGATVNIAP
jgi:hypothetical protein